MDERVFRSLIDKINDEGPQLILLILQVLKYRSQKIIRESLKLHVRLVLQYLAMAFAVLPYLFPSPVPELQQVLLEGFLFHAYPFVHQIFVWHFLHHLAQLFVDGALHQARGLGFL